ncbi:hypothetical protein [Pleomorphovibrio marinus]|uniref:hypothetical protein n=1 Tax=Pleomorphovibrio marinus TaxID=2164132 RepID=UPI000E0A5870|nr:hypothetical protein [Pleomorphovibrio marinus]
MPQIKLTSFSGFCLRCTVLIFVLGLGTFCSPGEENPISCVETPDINTELFQANADWVDISNVELLTNCLDIQFSYNGCTENADFFLVFSDRVIDTFPAGRSSRLHLTQDGDCNNTYVGNLQVDLRNIRIPDTDRVSINLEGWSDPILYVYSQN